LLDNVRWVVNDEILLLEEYVGEYSWWCQKICLKYLGPFTPVTNFLNMTMVWLKYCLFIIIIIIILFSRIPFFKGHDSHNIQNCDCSFSSGYFIAIRIKLWKKKKKKKGSGMNRLPHNRFHRCSTSTDTGCSIVWFMLLQIQELCKS